MNLDGGKAYNGPGALSDAPPPGARSGAPVLRTGSTGDESDAGTLARAATTNGNIGLTQNPDGTMALSRGSTHVATLSLSFAKDASGDVDNITTMTVLSQGHNTSYFGFGEHENGVLNQRGLACEK